MTSIEPSQFYTGIVAQIYSPLRSSMPPDADVYAGFIARSGEPALELGCGDGDPLLELRSRGLDVEGLDSSTDMLDQCRDSAQALGLKVVLHHQSMESLNIDREFRSIFIAGPTFNLLPDDDNALRALRGIRAHLAPGGAALIPLFVPTPTPEKYFGRARQHTAADGTEMSFAILAETRDDDARVQVSVTRYDLTVGDETSTVERDWLLHWYTDAGFRELAAAAGLVVKSFRTQSGELATPDDDSVVYILAAQE